jgi:hypothetical protein
MIAVLRRPPTKPATTDRGSRDKGERHRQQAHQQRQPAAIDDAAQHVTAELVGAERVECIADRPQTAQHRSAIGVCGSDPWRENRGEHDGENHDGGPDRNRIAKQPAADASPIAASDPRRREARNIQTDVGDRCHRLRSA